MIVSFQHKGLRRFFETGIHAGVQPWQTRRLQVLLTALQAAQNITDMDRPGFHLHPLKGMLPPRWSVAVSGNWRMTFEFSKGNAYAVDYEDYH